MSSVAGIAEEVRPMALTYDEADLNTFVADMTRNGLRVRHYRGRFHWEGPAVEVDHPDDAVGLTDVELQWDQLGLGWIVYPVARGKLTGTPGEGETY
jgi:hypothetical protein